MQMFGFSEFEPIIIVLGLLVFTFLLGLKNVKQDRECTVERLGNYHRTLKQGYHFVLPVIDRISAEIPTMELVLNIPTQSTFTKTGREIEIDGVIFFQIIDARKAIYEVNNFNKALVDMAGATIRTIVGSMDLEDLFEKRKNHNDRLLLLVADMAENWGIKIIEAKIQNISPAKKLRKVMKENEQLKKKLKLKETAIDVVQR